MDESQEVVLADSTAAPEQVATAAPVTEEVAPEAVEPAAEAPKTFSQEELDAAIGKRLAREQRKWEREQVARAAEKQLKTPVEIPPIEQFNSPDEYAEVLAERKAEELLARREQARMQSETLEAFHDREEEARNKYDDFEQVAYNPRLPITDAMAQTIQSSDVGPDMAYYLGSNPKEADRISRLLPLQQAKELGKIEAKLTDNPVVKKTSSAPAPIAPITARSSGSSATDTTDPRAIKSMTTSEWIEADRQRQIKKWEAQRNR